MTEVPAWSPHVAVVALAASIGFNIWQAWDRHRERKPDVAVEVGHLAGSPSWPGPREGQHSGNDRTAVYLAGRVHVSGTATVVAAGMAPPTGRRGWVELPDDVYTGVEGTDDHRSLPRTVTDGALLVRVERPHPLPPGITQDGGVRLWVRTSTGDLFVSDVPLVGLHERYRGPK